MEHSRREVKKLAHYHMEYGSRRIIKGRTVSCVIDLPLGKHYGEPLINRAEENQEAQLDNIFEKQALQKFPRMYGINMFQITALVKLTIVRLWIITMILSDNSQTW